MSDGDPPDEEGAGETPGESGSDRTPPADAGQRGDDEGPDAGTDDADGKRADTDATPAVGGPDTRPPDGSTASDREGYVVPTAAGSDAETAWLRRLSDAGELTPAAVEAMLSLHDDRGGRALEAVSEGRVKQYRDFTVVVGHAEEYVVEAGGCTCKDSAYNLDPDDPDDRCWHVLAVAIAERIGEIDHHGMWYSEVREFL